MTTKLDYGSDKYHSMCIYKITNTENSKVYIGQTTVTVKKRWAAHVTKTQGVSYINRAISKYGKNKFTFEVIDIAENRESLGHKEKFWIKYYNSLVPNGYNIREGGFSDNARSEDFKLAMSEMKSKLHGSKRSREFVRKHRTEEEKAEAKRLARERISASKRGKSSHMAGKSHSEQTKLKISVAKTGTGVPKLRKSVIRSDGIIFDSIKAAAQATGVHDSGIQAVLAGRAKTTGGYSFKYYKKDDTWHQDKVLSR